MIGGIGGAYIAPRERRLGKLAEQEVAVVPAAAGGVSWSGEYRAAARQADLARLLQLVLAAATILFMSLRL